LGAKFDAWNEHFCWDAWQQAFADAGLEMSFYTHRRRALDEVLPWDHISVAVAKSYLARDYQRSLAGQTRDDCRGDCDACGVLLAFADLRGQVPAEAWECPPVTPKTEGQHCSAQKADGAAVALPAGAAIGEET
jgi:hypothetical protein